jgi:hypothetical protein
MKIRHFRGAAKVMKHGDTLRAALAPPESVVVDAPMPAAASAAEAALAGDHRPAAALLRHTLEARAWDDRTHVVDMLAKASLRAPQWLDDWDAADPEDGGAALVRASTAIHRAWEHRSRLQASEVTQEQLDAFHATLSDATALLQRAVDMLPGDPEPWHLALIHARGLEAPPEVWLDYLSSVRDVDPWHYAGHRAAMELLTEKWFGSHDEMYDFAARVAAEAPEGHRLRTLPLDAVFEHMAKEGPQVAAVRPGATEAVDLAAQWVTAHDDLGHHVVAGHRNTLVFVLFHLQNFRAAYDELVAVGPYATSYPWGYYGEPREIFLQYRNHVVVKTAAAM